jgi:hypothetical protein
MEAVRDRVKPCGRPTTLLWRLAADYGPQLRNILDCALRSGHVEWWTGVISPGVTPPAAASPPVRPLRK